MDALSSESKVVAAIEAEMRRLIDRSEDAYVVGRRIWEIALAHASSSPEVVWPMWLIWGALTDWVEMKADESSLAKREMERASREWLAIDRSDSKARSAYFDRWVHDELGIERKELP